MDQSICFDGQCDGGGLHHSPEGHSLVFSLLSCHFPGDEFLVADFLSRGKVFSAEWMLNQEVFQRTCQVFLPPPEINLFFASALNFQFRKYCARLDDPAAWKKEALSFPWKFLSLFAFPRFLFYPESWRK